MCAKTEEPRCSFCGFTQFEIQERGCDVMIVANTRNGQLAICNLCLQYITKVMLEFRIARGPERVKAFLDFLDGKEPRPHK
jgi:hypothetical protein